jgi:hypothetical protein
LSNKAWQGLVADMLAPKVRSRHAPRRNRDPRKRGEDPGMSATNRRKLLGSLTAVAAAISVLERKVARGYQLGTASEVDWFNKGKAFYSQYLDVVLRIYEIEFEKDRTNTNGALNGGAAGERKGYLKWYMTFDPNNMTADQKPQNRADRRLEVFSKIKALRDANERDGAKYQFFDQLLKLTFPKDDLVRRVSHPGDMSKAPVVLNANAYILSELYQTKILNDHVSSTQGPALPSH